jgi:hypothetical protein
MAREHYPARKWQEDDASTSIPPSKAAKTCSAAAAHTQTHPSIGPNLLAPCVPEPAVQHRILRAPKAATAPSTCSGDPSSSLLVKICRNGTHHGGHQRPNKSTVSHYCAVKTVDCAYTQDLRQCREDRVGTDPLSPTCCRGVLGSEAVPQSETSRLCGLLREGCRVISDRSPMGEGRRPRERMLRRIGGHRGWNV